VKFEFVSPCILWFEFLLVIRNSPSPVCAADGTSGHRLNYHNVVCRYVVLGNHDHYGDAEAQIQFSGMQPSPDAGGRKWILPHYFWTTEKVVGTAKLQLVFIDTVLLDMDITRKTLEDKIGHGVVNESALADFDTNRPAREKHREEQLSWLEGILSASSADFLIVIGHYPVYSGGEHGSTPSLLTKVGRSTIHH
jgi:tartrate-resistant acid phosphatase type 5